MNSINFKPILHQMSPQSFQLILRRFPQSLLSLAHPFSQFISFCSLKSSFPAKTHRKHEKHYKENISSKTALNKSCQRINIIKTHEKGRGKHHIKSNYQTPPSQPFACPQANQREEINTNDIPCNQLPFPRFNHI